MIEKEKLLEVSKKIRKCQRGWELDKSIPMEHIELLSEIAKHSPSKQDEAYFDVYVITQRSLIEKYYKESIGFTAFKEETKPENLVVYENSQSRANAVFSCHTTSFVFISFYIQTNIQMYMFIHRRLIG